MDPITIGLGLLKFAPAVAGWLGGDDAEKTATKIVGMAENLTGTKGADTLKALANNPALALQFEQLCMEERTTELRLYAQDRDSARAMTTALVNAGHGTAWASSIVSTVVTVGFFVILYVVFTGELPAGSKDIAFMLLGTLAAGFTQVLNFWLGSSKGSKDKTVQMAKG